MKRHRHPFCRRHNLTHTRHINVAVFIKQADHQTGETQLAHCSDVFQHRVKLTRRVAKISAARANNRVNGNGHRFANRLQYAVGRRQTALFRRGAQFYAIGPVLLRRDSTFHAVTTNLQ
ncbi:hypothetical protein D3C85_1367640 [compost metagenome]